MMYNDVDICLDTFPYSGTTTSCDGFMMSTPIITLAIPDRHVSNVTG
jgi:protein O-GlcNAc transferase